MRRLTLFAMTMATFHAPAPAAEDHGRAASGQTGILVGARVRLPLGARTSAKPQASLGIAMEREVQSSRGRTILRGGEALGLRFANQGPVITLAGAPANRAFQKHANTNSGDRFGISTTALVGIGAVIVVAGVVAISQLTCVGKDKDFCGSD